jgi:hypothetical protein
MVLRTELITIEENLFSLSPAQRKQLALAKKQLVAEEKQPASA